MPNRSSTRANGFGSELADVPVDHRRDLFGGKGSVSVADLLRGVAAPPFSAVLACELAPGGTVGTHHQQRDPELVICLAGHGVVTVEGVERAMHPGSVAFLPFGHSLALRNDSADEPLRYLIIKAQVAIGP